MKKINFQRVETRNQHVHSQIIFPSVEQMWLFDVLLHNTWLLGELFEFIEYVNSAAAWGSRWLVDPVLMVWSVFSILQKCNPKKSKGENMMITGNIWGNRSLEGSYKRLGTLFACS